MKHIVLYIAGFLILFTSNALAQAGPRISTTKITKILQVGYYYSGASQNYIIVGTNVQNGVYQTFKLRGVAKSGVIQSCVDLASKLNTNALGVSSNLTIGYVILRGGGGGSSTNITNEYTIDLKSCYLNSAYSNQFSPD